MSNISMPIQRYLFNSDADTRVLCYNNVGAVVPNNDAGRVRVNIQQVGDFLLAPGNLVGKTILAGAAASRPVATVTGFPTAVAGQEVILYIRVESLSNFGENLDTVNNPYEKRFSFVATGTLTATQVATRLFQIITKRNDLNRFTVTDDAAGTLTFTFLDEAILPRWSIEVVDTTFGGTGGALPSLLVTFTTAPTQGNGNYGLLSALFFDNAKPNQARYERSKLPQQDALYRTYILTYRPPANKELDNNVIGAQEFKYEIYVNQNLTTLITALNQALA